MRQLIVELLCDYCGYPFKVVWTVPAWEPNSVEIVDATNYHECRATINLMKFCAAYKPEDDDA